MMKITELTAVDNEGVEHKWEGWGFVMETSEQLKTPGGGMSKVVGLSVEAKLVVPNDG